MKTCKDCGKSKADIEFRKWSRQCHDCYNVGARERYATEVKPHTLKAQRSTLASPARQQAKADYAALMRERLGLTFGTSAGDIQGCEWLSGGGLVKHTCPLIALCHELEVGGAELLFCELEDSDAGVIPFRPTGIPEPHSTRAIIELWADTTMPVKDGLQRQLWPE